MSKDEKRKWLKARGWSRHDRACGPNASCELWQPPWNEIGFAPGLVSLDWAFRKEHRREDVKLVADLDLKKEREIVQFDLTEDEARAMRTQIC